MHKKSQANTVVEYIRNEYGAEPGSLLCRNDDPSILRLKWLFLLNLNVKFGII